jgi:predicted transcriptional regulator
MATIVANGEMAMNGELKISESEWDVMEKVWEAGTSTAADVIKALRSTHEWNHSTI